MKKRNFGIFLIALIIMPVFALLIGCATIASKKQIDVFYTAKTARIVVNQSYGKAGRISLPFEDVAKRFLGYAGLRVVTDTDDYDLMMKIEAKGRALSANYYNVGRLYSGASLSGTISLETQGVPTYKKSFRGTIPTPELASIAKNPANAPFRGAFNTPGSFISKIAEMIGEVYGADALIPAMNDEDSWIRREAAEALSKIGKPAVDPLITAIKDELRGAAGTLRMIKDPQAVEPLIAALKDKNSDVRGNAVFALGEIGDPRAVESLITALKDKDSFVRGWATGALVKITGKNFRKNPKKWQEWWEKNKNKFLKGR